MQICLNIANDFFIYCVLAISFLVIYNTSKFFHISHAVTITIAPYLVYLFSSQFAFSFETAMPLAIIIATILGVLSEICIYKPLRKRRVSSMAMLIASLGLYTVQQNCISIFWGNDTKMIGVNDIKVGHYLFGAYVTSIQIIIIIVCIFLILTTALILKFNKIGRSIRAVSSNSELCDIFGLNANKVTIWAFIIGSILAAIIGILVALNTNLTPTMGFNLLLYGVVAMIIGGVGSIWGVVGGALLLATAQHLAGYYIGSQWMDAMAYIILILFLIWKPLGFSGKRLKKNEI